MQVPPCTLEIDTDVYLRPISEVDRDTLYGIVDSDRDDLTRYLRLWDIDIDGIDRFLRESERKWESPTSDVAYGIFEHGHFVGLIGLLRLDAKNRATELSYWLAKSAQGRGIMTRCVAKVLELMFTALDANQVIITSYADNWPSRRVAERTGFQLDGVTRQWRFDKNGQLHDKATYSILVGEWEAGRGSEAT